LWEIAKGEMISISRSILISLTNCSHLTLPNDSLKRLKHADEFEEQFSAGTHVILFNLLRAFEGENHTTISIPTEEKIEQVYVLVLMNFGNLISCGSPKIDSEVVLC
jgi:hypothetical protein